MFDWFKYTEAKLAKDVIKACQVLDAQTQYAYDPDSHLVQSQETRIYLSNLFDLVKDKSKEEREAHIHSFIRSSLEETHISYEQSSHLLVPRLKSTAEFCAWEQQLATQSDELHILHYPMTDNFVWMLGIDGETAIHTVMDKDLRKMDLNLAEAFKHAKVNLNKINDSPFSEIEPGMYQSAMSDDHDAARILLTERIAQLDVKGNPIAFVPSNNDLYICGSEDFGAIERMASRSLEIYQSRRPVSLNILEFHDGQWRDFAPPKIEAFAPVHNLHTLETSSQYDQQQQWLDHQNEQAGQDVFVATHSLYERDDDPLLFSVCVWSENVETWLPEADIVHFYGQEEGSEPDVLGALPWDKVTELFGDLMKPLGMTPERYELSGFPDKAQLYAAIDDD